MDLDDLSPRKVPAINFAGEDLTDYSLSALEERVALLEAEIARCRSLIAQKRGTRAAADGLFKI